MNPENNEINQPREATQSAPPAQPPVQTPPRKVPPQTPPSGWQQPPQGKPPFGWIPPQGYQAQQYTPPAPQYAAPAYQLPHKRVDSDDVLAQAKTPRSFVVILLAWIFGLMFSNFIIQGGLGLSVPIVNIVFYGIALWYFRGKKSAFSMSSLLLLIPIFLLSFGFLVSDSGMTQMITTLVLIVLIPLQLTKMSGCSLADIFSPRIIPDVFVSILKPFNFLDAPFKAIRISRDDKKTSNHISKALIGVVCAIPFMIIFIWLFSGADAVFSEILSRIFEDIDIWSIVRDLILGTAIAIFVAAWFITLRGRRTPKLNESNFGGKTDGTAIAAFLFIINIIQLAFVAVQFAYLFSPRDSLPGGILVAEYARSGFFQLVWVVVISALLITTVIIIARKKENGRLPLPVSISVTILILCSYVIFASGIYRMMMYIGKHDLTVKRVFSTWLMILLALCITGAIIKLWIPKFKSLAWVCGCVIAMTLLINIVNINGVIAKYNVDQYFESGYTREIYMEVLRDLGPAASKDTARLLEVPDGEVRENAQKTLRYHYSDLQEKTWKSYCLTDFAAQKIFDDKEIEPFGYVDYCDFGRRRISQER